MSASNQSLSVIDILDGTIVDGPGLRLSIYFAGCEHHCPGCHNPSTWDFDSGKPTDISEILQAVEASTCKGVTLTGGDPLYQPIEQLTLLAKQLKHMGKSIWLYTGFKFEDVVQNNRFSQLLSTIDVMVDGPFVESLRNIDLLFKGSSNQRIIDVAHWNRTGQIKLWEPDW
ncbi:MAG: anaerobic ribonucleoside-triphosphate reductase activating protein [Bacteroides sp.]|nr:anaerobic ribonucleoside-triphosphate reductase activating protein [Bacteroides sp.]